MVRESVAIAVELNHDNIFLGFYCCSLPKTEEKLIALLDKTYIHVYSLLFFSSQYLNK